MRVLLTGASGWLGRSLALQLREAGHAVVGLDVAPGPDTTVLGSVVDRELVERAFVEHAPDAVIHAGALHKPDILRYPAQAFVDVNVTGTLNLLDAAVAAGHDRFVFTSTTSLMISEAIRAGRERRHARGVADGSVLSVGAAQHLRRHQTGSGTAVPPYAPRA